MTRSHTDSNGLGLVHVAVLLVVGVVALIGNAGCDTTGMGGYDDWSWVDADTVQSVLDYRQDVYDTANQAWDDYIRM